MYFLTDRVNRVIFGWSAKCGCTHVKNLFYFLTNNRPFTDLHRSESYGDLPTNFKDYTIIIVTRNPFDRLVSGFKEKYMEGKFSLQGYDRKTLTFQEFTKELVDNAFEKIELHHFTHQLSEKWRNVLSTHPNIKFYDLHFIDYDYISSLYKGRVITDQVRNYRGEHNITLKSNETHEEPVYNSTYDSYRNNKVDSTLFYNDEIEEIIKKFYEKDFEQFRSVGINYNLGVIHIEKPFESTPSLLKKFRFYKGKDHVNDDMFYVDKQAGFRTMILTALNTPGCKGFNTLGFMKKEIDYKNLKPSKYFSEEDGIYLRIDL